MLFGSKTDILMRLLKFDVISTSTFPPRAPGDGGSLCLIQCYATSILSRSMFNISYDR